MAQTNISIRVDENLKQEFDALCNELGFTMSTALTVFIKTVVREQRIPFEISTVPKSIQALQKMEDDWYKRNASEQAEELTELINKFEN